MIQLNFAVHLDHSENDVIDIKTVQRWFQRFRSGNENVKNGPRGRPKPAVRDNELKNLIEQNPRTTVRKISLKLNTSHSTVSRHLKKIGKVKKMDRFVPHQLNESQRNRRLTVCSMLVSQLEKEAIFESNHCM